MNFVSLRVITDDVARLVAFYEQVTGVQAAVGDARTSPNWWPPRARWRSASTRTVALFGVDSAQPATNHTAIIEFRVADVDAEHQRLSAAGCEFVQEPTTMPWGNRSLLFRDPDGNLVNFFTPVTADALQRQAN